MTWVDPAGIVFGERWWRSIYPPNIGLANMTKQQEQILKRRIETPELCPYCLQIRDRVDRKLCRDCRDGALARYWVKKIQESKNEVTIRF